jgi:hypothetical protein
MSTLKSLRYRYDNPSKYRVETRNRTEITLLVSLKEAVDAVRVSDLHNILTSVGFIIIVVYKNYCNSHFTLASAVPVLCAVAVFAIAIIFLIF